MPKANKHTQVFRIVFLTPFAIHLCASCYEQEHGCNWKICECQSSRQGAAKEDFDVVKKFYFAFQKSHYNYT